MATAVLDYESQTLPLANIPSTSDIKRRLGFSELYAPTFLRKVVAEMIGTYMLVFATCGAAGLSKNDDQLVSRLGASLVGGLIVAVMIYSIGHISGAHMNPAVTVAFASARHFAWKQVPIFIMAQLSGAIVASYVLKVILDPITEIGITAPSKSPFQALGAEIVTSFVLMFVTSAVATDFKGAGQLAGMACGCAVTITSIFAGPISGGSMNPARTLGPAIAWKTYKAIWVYIVGPLIGTNLGAWSYSLIRDAEKPFRPLP
ncbi:hypothetical protein AMTRI_Chr04g190190 [Amborella trichopoda]|uniref:Uncharacterized protein n=1 Tax=Amborella trichopoda TaxID=13333 RepID=W1NG57_AMBTC|nr:aquaporin NIP2-1 [Amborella trichopoda]ERM94473.1 hypothetical protein AMTR_s00010p00260950 [Amborella trichopoda]|eukprot:XP_006827236.1 aquaporin NIP2-1 [Amborella trichopoda]